TTPFYCSDWQMTLIGVPDWAGPAASIRLVRPAIHRVARSDRLRPDRFGLTTPTRRPRQGPTVDPADKRDRPTRPLGLVSATHLGLPEPKRCIRPSRPPRQRGAGAGPRC